MKNIVYGLFVVLLLLVGCKNGVNSISDKTKNNNSGKVNLQFVNQLIVSLKYYSGEKAEQGKIIAKELMESPVVFDESGGGFTVNKWRYDSTKNILTKDILNMPDERAWIVVEVVTEASGKVRIKTISEQREHVQIKK